MPNIATALRDEVTRLSRRAVRSQVDPARKAVAQHRRDIAALKRQVAALERLVAQLTRKVSGARPEAAAEAAGTPRRFSAKGLQSQRSRLALSAGDFGRLMGVSAQTIYSWERATAHPRREQLAKLAALRGIGKREATKRVQQQASAGTSPSRKA
jgi:DNA-binding transcriptional regulator YiaG